MSETVVEMKGVKVEQTHGQYQLRKWSLKKGEACKISAFQGHPGVQVQDRSETEEKEVSCMDNDFLVAHGDSI